MLRYVRFLVSKKLCADYDFEKIETSLLDHFLELVEESDEDKNGKIDFGEWEVMGKFLCCPISGHRKLNRN